MRVIKGAESYQLCDQSGPPEFHDEDATLEREQLGEVSLDVILAVIKEVI